MGVPPVKSIVSPVAKCHDLEPIYRTLEHFEEDIPEPAPSLPRRIRTIQQYVHDHLFEPDLTVRSIRERCRIRDNNVTGRFRHRLGLTVKQYITRLRMKAAERVLRHEELSIFDISLSLGYKHPQTFYRHFKRHYNCTPAVFRKRLQGSDDSASRRRD